MRLKESQDLEDLKNLKELEPLKDIKWKINIKIRRILDFEDLMPDNIKQLIEDMDNLIDKYNDYSIEKSDKEMMNKKYYGLALEKPELQEFLQKKIEKKNFIDIIEELKVKIKLVGENGITVDFKKLTELQSVMDILGKDKISEIEINKATERLNIYLSKVSKDCVIMIPEQKMLKDAIDKTIEKSEKLKHVVNLNNIDENQMYRFKVK